MNQIRRSLLASAAALSLPIALDAEEAAGLRARVLGAWRLLDAVTVHASGRTEPWMGRPGPYRGLIIYGASGMMSAQIASDRAPAKGRRRLGEMAATDQLKYLATYYAYFGRFEVDEAKSEVHHIIEASLDPSETGTTYVRKVALVNGRMTLTTEPRQVNDETRYNRLVWARV